MTNINDKLQAGGISVHAVDISRGIPAHELRVRLWIIDNKRLEVASGTCNASGLLDHPIATGTGVKPGTYEIEFDVGAYFRAAGVDMPNPSFLDVAMFRFGIEHVNEHFHLPFKFTPWGFSLFRGGA